MATVTSFLSGISPSTQARKKADEASAEVVRLQEELDRMKVLLEDVKHEEELREEKDHSASAYCCDGCAGCGILCWIPGLFFAWVAYVAIYCLVSGYFEGTGCVENYTQILIDANYDPKFVVKETGSSKSDDDVFEHVPRKLRGVFWMDGNPLPEVLATFQYGRYYSKEQMLITPKVPWGWGFWGEEHVIPNYEPNCGSALTSTCVGTPHMYNVSGKNIAQSYTSGVEDLWVVKIESDPEEGDFFARLQMNQNGDLGSRWVDLPPDGVPQDYTFEQDDDGVGPAGTRFFRGVYFGCGMVPPWRYGYTAKKIIDEDGNRVQPYFDEYLTFMQEHRIIIMWEADGW
eukprot:CAMPEP_0115364136 /NCGR_PEP_ID=MMETSP0270-20121206/103600_1 /TAXON_ID=71861 /ORGANISM="Scrippsiella trochoidea, Strain CCMP3099" /LENGTH=343 /DNA_ID=CAMNT_0002786799 /DNA_START=54 /DNA_END=1085 /DNA_ORIENTATION=+